MKLRILRGLVLGLFVLSLPVLGQAAALTSGTIYRVEVDAIGSNGAVVDLNFSTLDAADTNGKISFLFTGLPDRTSYNFFVVTVRDGILATDPIVRRSLVPVALEGATTNLGVSVVTGAQTSALLSAMAVAGSDNPIMVVMGMTIIRNAAMTDAELVQLGEMGGDAAAAFEADLLTYTADVNAAKVLLFKSAIVSRLNQFSSLYKDSVEATDGAGAANKRGEAANLMLRIMVESATEAGFSEDYVDLAFNAAGDVVKTNFLAGNYNPISPPNNPIMAAINAQMGGAMQNMNAEKSLKKFSLALADLSATQAQIDRYNTAATTLFTAMKTAFQDFEQLFLNPETMATEAEIAAKDIAMGAAMQTAFAGFMSDAASTNAEILALRTSMFAAFFTGFPGTMDDALPAQMFTFYSSEGVQANWPITLAVTTSWVVNVKNNGGALTYAPRDTLVIPLPMMNWLDSWDYQNPDYPGPPAPYITNKTRHDFGTVNANGVNGDEFNISASLAALFGLKEDIQIAEMSRWDGQTEANWIIKEKAFLGHINTIESHIGGTSNGTAALTDAVKKALVTLSLSPEF